MGKYDHWFWNSWLVDKLASKVSKFNSWLWTKQYGKKD